jgi:hypothetical protein
MAAMASKIWRRIEARTALSVANSDLDWAKKAADWAAIHNSFVGSLRRRGMEPMLSVRSYDVFSLGGRINPIEHAWWPRGRASEIERDLLLADREGVLRGIHLHGGAPKDNAALATVRLLDHAEAAGPQVATAMLVSALLHFREARGNDKVGGYELRARARAAIDAAHPIMKELYWNPGSKNVLPISFPTSGKATDLEGLAELLADDGALLIADWIPVRLKSPQSSWP